MTKITEQRLSELNCNTITDREIRKLVKAYRKAKYGDGWIEWKGGDRPVPEGTLIKAKWSDGEVTESVLNRDFSWRHHDDPSVPNLIAYRVL